MKIYFIGFMGCGKSSVGKKIANKLGYTFIDLDDFIEKKAGLTIPDIFSREGEDYFRKLETYSLKEIASLDKVVVSTGGGTPCFNSNMDLINSSGMSIYLKMSAETLYSRLRESKTERPLLSAFTEFELKQYVVDKLLEREFYYSQAHFKVKAKGLKTEEMHDFLKQNLVL
ncbi:MAG: shikimate kinase [Bacteroidetes bacterium]|nr:shikimate kinase [Bacteroidota bacterium]